MVKVLSEDNKDGKIKCENCKYWDVLNMMVGERLKCRVNFYLTKPSDTCPFGKERGT